MTAVAHLLAGFVGAGKTTFARRLQQSTGATCYSNDARMIARHGRCPPANRYASYFARIETEIWAAASADLCAGNDVIIDSGFWTRASRDDARQRVQACKAEPRLYWLRCPESVMLARVLERNRRADPASLGIDESGFYHLLQRLEPLQADEARIEIDGTSQNPDTSHADLNLPQ